MSALEPSCPATAGAEYFNIAEPQEKDLKTAGIKMIEAFKSKLTNPSKK